MSPIVSWPAARRPRGERIPSNLRFLLGANLISSLGSGLTLPFLLIYLHDVRHIALGVTGLLIGAAALVGIPAGPLSGALVDRLGARWVCAAAMSAAALSTLGLVEVHSVASAVPVLLFVGFGQSAMWPTWNSVFAVMVPDEGLRPRVFARSFQLMNLGLGAGAMVAGSVVRVADPRTFLLIYVIDAATTLVVVLALLVLPARDFALPEPSNQDVAPRAGGFRQVLSDRRFLRYIAAMCFLAFAGYSAIDAGLVGYATHVVHVGPYVIAWAFGLNTGLIVLSQPFGLRLTARWRRTSSLMTCAALFGVSWLVLLAGGSFPRSKAGDILVVAMFGVFSLGEVLLSPVGFPLVTMMAPPELQGRYNATASTVYTSMFVIGPSIAGAFLGAGLGTAYLVLLMGSAGVAIFAFWQLRHVLSSEIDNVRGPAAAVGAAGAAASEAGDRVPSFEA